MIENYKNYLKQYFGYDAFRDGQEELINDICNEKDVVGIMPTGAGKSICFQIPALMMEGITIIISPLISLMKDQVNALTQSGISAAFINSSLTEKQIQTALYNAGKNAYKLIYVAPERLLSEDFLDFTQSISISMLTVDEAHCISQWGHDFRPSYAKIPEFIEQLPKRPIVSAFTATATPHVRQDIINLLQLKNPTVVGTGFDRPNLYFEIQKPKNKFAALLEFLQDKKDKSGIIYCSTRVAVEEICEDLQQNGYNTSRYHAGLSDRERHENQEDFIFDRVQIMTATNAFGMGIDKSNVSFVVHYNMPKDMESYYQEAGRAGRDGEPADCVLLYSGQDVRTNMWLIENGREPGKTGDPDLREQLLERERAKLREITFYCATNDCLREYILKYFGETPPNNCGNCGNCNTSFETVDVTIAAQKILSCIYRMNERYGVKMIIDTLRGSKNEKIQRFGLDKLTTYNICEESQHQLRTIIQHLILSDYLIKTDDEYPIIKLGERADEILRQKSVVSMKLSKEKERDFAKPERKITLKPVDKRLFEVLRNIRTNIANEQKVPAFTIFHDSTLTDMCMKTPKSEEELLDISGVGQVKAQRYGKLFLDAISDFLQNNELQKTEISTLKEFDPSDIEITDEPTTISVIADKINCVLLECGYKKINGQKINDWLVTEGFLKLVTYNERNYKVPTKSGEELGIKSEERIIRDVQSKINIFNNNAQKFVINSSAKICGIH